MKKIITAMGNPQLNIKLKEINKYEIVSKDIQYQEALLEILDNKKDVEILILSELLSGEINIKEFILNIKKIIPSIEIILFLEKENEELKNFLISKGIFKIYLNNELSMEEIINIIDNLNINSNEDIREEIKILKEMISKENNNKLEKKQKIKEKINKKNNNQNINGKIISISGLYGSGKSIISAILGVYFKSKRIKTLIIDFDIFNNSISTIFGVKKVPKNINKENIVFESLIIKRNKYLDLVCGIEFLFNNDNKIDDYKLKELFNKIKNKYDLIIIDTSSETYFKYSKLILNNSDKIIFLMGSNAVEIKKAKDLLKIYIEDWLIQKQKINILFNKININFVKNIIIKNIFNEIKIIGKIKFNNNYNLLINKNMNEIFFSKNIKTDIKKIEEKIF